MAESPVFLVLSAEQLGKVLRGIRKSQGLSQTEVAGNAGLRQKTVSALENATGKASIDTLMRCISVLDVELSLHARPSEQGVTGPEDW